MLSLMLMLRLLLSLMLMLIVDDDDDVDVDVLTTANHFTPDCLSLMMISFCLFNFESAYIVSTV